MSERHFDDCPIFDLIAYAAECGYGITFGVNQHNQWAIGYMTGMGGGDLVADSDLAVAVKLAADALDALIEQRG